LHGLGRSGRVRTDPKRVGSSMGFFEIFLPTLVLGPSVRGHGLGHGSDCGNEFDGSGLTRSDFFKTLFHTAHKPSNTDRMQFVELK
jgi:hypothetical protein